MVNNATTSADFRPATNRQLWAIRCATNVDRRADNLSYDDAVAILAVANKGTKYDKSGVIPAPLAALNSATPKKAVAAKKKVAAKKPVTAKDKTAATSKKLYEGLKGLLLKESNINYLAESMVGEMKIGSVISNDTSMMAPGPKYVFLGGGCGFAWVKCRKSPKSDAIIEFGYQLKRSDVDKVVLKRIVELCPDLMANCAKSGNPIQAHQMQNEMYNHRFQQLIANFMETQGIKAYADSRQD